jgi:hypothetical protein
MARAAGKPGSAAATAEMCAATTAAAKMSATAEMTAAAAMATTAMTAAAVSAPASPGGINRAGQRDRQHKDRQPFDVGHGILQRIGCR